MRATILIPVAVLLAVGGAIGVGVSLTSSAESAPVAPIVVQTPVQQAPPAPAARPVQDGSVMAPPDIAGVPAPPPALNRLGDDDDDDDDDDRDDDGDDD